jgi:hypothetical protein
MAAKYYDTTMALYHTIKATWNIMQQAAYIQATCSNYASLNITSCNFDTY